MAKGFLSFNGKQWAVIIVLFILAILISSVVGKYMPSLSPQFSPSYVATGAASGIIYADDVNKLVGINTKTPRQALEIYSAGGGPRVSLDSPATTPGSWQAYQFTANGVYKGGFQREKSTDDLQFYIANGNNIPSLVLKNSNNFVGIGTSDPQAKLDVIGSVKVSGNLLVSNLTSADSGSYYVCIRNGIISQSSRPCRTGANINVLGSTGYRNDYYIIEVTGNGTASGTYFLKLSQVANQSGTSYSSDKVTFTDVMSGAIYDTSITSKGSGTVIIGGREFKVSYSGSSTNPDEIAVTLS